MMKHQENDEKNMATLYDSNCFFFCKRLQNLTIFTYFTLLITPHNMHIQTQITLQKNTYTIFGIFLMRTIVFFSH